MMYIYIVMPTLFPSYNLSKVKTIITDDRPQEFMQIHNAKEIINLKMHMWLSPYKNGLDPSYNEEP